MFYRQQLSLFAALFLFFNFYSIVEAKIVINEVLNNPSGEESGSEWVELYNTGISPETLNGCVLFLDADTVSQRVNFGESDFIDKFKVVSWDSSWLKNSGDTVKIVCGSDSDIVAYGDENGSVVDDPDDGISFGRNPDGSGGFMTLASVTLGEPNSNPPTITPLPTYSPTPTPERTPTPKPTSTQKPTSTNSPTPTTKPTNTLTPTTRPLITSELTYPENITTNNTNDPTKGIVAGIQVESESSDSSESKTDGVSQTKKFPVAATILITIGILLLVVSLLPIIRNFKKRYN